MKKLLALLAFSLVFSSSALAESCPSLLRGKNFDRKDYPRDIYIAWNTHTWDGETKWDKCSLTKEATFFNAYTCGGREYRVNSLSGRMAVDDKSGRAFEVDYKGDWEKGTFDCEKLADGSYKGGDTTWRKAVVEVANVKILLRMDDDYKYTPFSANF